MAMIYQCSFRPAPRHHARIFLIEYVYIIVYYNIIVYYRFALPQPPLVPPMPARMQFGNAIWVRLVTIIDLS